MNITISFGGVTLVASITSMLWISLIYLLKHPEKTKIYGALLLSIIRFSWKGIKSVEKIYIKMDTEGRVNNFLQERLVKVVGDFLVKKVKIIWVEDEEIKVTKEEFIRNGELFIQLQKSENQDSNFLNAALFLISQCIVPNQRNYLSEEQKKSVDLYSSLKFFELEKPQIVSSFYDEFIGEYQKNSAIGLLIEKFIQIDEYALFFPILIQELQLLSQKIILDRNKENLHKEVNDLITFLLTFVRNRKQSIEGILVHKGFYCKCHILLVGKRNKMLVEGIEPYVKSISISTKDGIESIYIISHTDSTTKDFVTRILLKTKASWFFKNEFIISRKKKDKVGQIYSVENSIVVLRRQSTEALLKKKYLPLQDIERQHVSLGEHNKTEEKSVSKIAAPRKI